MKRRELTQESDERAFAEGIGDGCVESKRRIVFREIADPGSLCVQSVKLRELLDENISFGEKRRCGGQS